MNDKSRLQMQAAFKIKNYLIKNANNKIVLS